MATFTNQATLTYNGIVTASNIAVGELLEAITSNKTAVTDTYTAGEAVTYVINLANTTSTAYSNLTITDNLGAYTQSGTTVYPLNYQTNSLTTYVNGELQTTSLPVVTAGPPMTITNVNLPANGNVILVYKATLTNVASPESGGSITNTATISGTTLNTITVTETINAATNPILSIGKSISPSVVSEDDTVTYTFLLENSGNTALTTADNAIITDQFNPILSNLAVTFNGTTWAEGVNYTYSQTTGLFTTAANQITVPAATYTQDATTGVWSTTPGTSTLVISGTV